MDLEVTKIGNWDGFENMLKKAASQFKAAIKKATDESGRLMEARMVERIQSNQVTPRTSQEFVAYKERLGFSHTTLVMTGSLINAIKYENKAWNEGFVGVNRNAEKRAAVRREKKVVKAKAKLDKSRAKTRSGSAKVKKT